MKKNSGEELKFSTLKIKRIIQENKEIGKIANMSPYVICKIPKLFYFPINLSKAILKSYLSLDLIKFIKVLFSKNEFGINMILKKLTL